MTKNDDTTLLPIEQISSSILLVRGHRVIVDRDLAAIYGVKTGRLNEAVKRNAQRFPADFMFQLTREEAERSRSQNAILNSGPTGALETAGGRGLLGSFVSLYEAASRYRTRDGGTPLCRVHVPHCVVAKDAKGLAVNQDLVVHRAALREFLVWSYVFLCSVVTCAPWIARFSSSEGYLFQSTWRSNSTRPNALAIFDNDVPSKPRRKWVKSSSPMITPCRWPRRTPTAYASAANSRAVGLSADI
jgi:hypothetical protein